MSTISRRSDRTPTIRLLSYQVNEPRRGVCYLRLINPGITLRRWDYDVSAFAPNVYIIRYVGGAIACAVNVPVVEVQPARRGAGGEGTRQRSRQVLDSREVVHVDDEHAGGGAGNQSYAFSWVFRPKPPNALGVVCCLIFPLYKGAFLRVTREDWFAPARDFKGGLMYD